MSLDLFFKKYFPAVILLLLAMAAFFQALGVSYLVQAMIAPGSGPTFAALPPIKVDAIARPRAEAIHNRNPFDSVTGPLNAEEIPEVTTEKKAVVVDDPLSVPRCAGVTIHILTESDDPLWSFAALTGPGEKEPVIRRVGDDLGGQKVAYIGFNPLMNSPTVWLEGDTLCQANLFALEDVPPPQEKPEEAGEKEEAAPPANRRSANAVDPDIANKIKKLSDTEFEVDRSAVDKILENQSALMRSARIVPEQKDGKVVGIRLFGVRPETLLGKLGLKNGDRLETINGFNMGSPEKALEAYARLRTANNLELTLDRRGKPTTINIHIK